jgi:hypothetical protein
VADVRVRLSAEGVAEVVAALRKVSAESAAAGSAGAKGFANFGSVLGGLKGALGALGIAATFAAGAAAAKQFALSGVQAADAMQRVQARTAASQANLAGLKLAADEAELSLEDVVGRLRTVNQATSAAARAPRGEAAAPLRSIGLDTKQIANFANQDAIERLDTIAQAFAKLPPSVDRTNAAVAIFGKTGSELVPMLDALGQRGLPALVARARELGIVLSDEVVAKAAAVDKSFDTIGTQAGALAIQFAAGFSTPIRQALAAVSAQVAGTGRTWQELGNIVGRVLQVVVVLIAAVLDTAFTLVKVTADAVGFAVRFSKKFFTGDLQGMARAGQDFREGQFRATGDFLGRMKNLFAQGFSPPPPDDPPKPPRDLTARIEDQNKDRLEIGRVALERELRQTRAAAKLAEQEEEAAFDRRLRTIQEHYDARRKIVEDQAKAETAALQKARAVIEQFQPAGTKRDQSLQSIDDQLGDVAGDRSAKLAELTAKQEAEVRNVGEEQIRILTQIRELEGDHHAQALLEIDERVEKAREAFRKLPKQGLGADEVAARLGSLLDSRLAAEEVARSASNQLDIFSRDRAAIEARADAGLLSQVQAEQRILELEKSRLTTLQALAQALVRVAQDTKDPERIADAQEFMDSVAAISLSVEAAENDMARIGAAAVDASEQGLTSFLSLEQGLGGAVQGMVGHLQRLAAQLLATKILMGILGAFAGGVGGPGSIDQEFSTSNILPRYRGGPILRRARGGPLRGAGTSTSDSNLAMSFPSRRLYAWSDGEHIMNARAASRHRPLLDAMNARPEAPLAQLAQLPALLRSQQFTLADSTSAAVRGLAAGGPVGDIVPAAERGAESRFGGTLEVALSEGLLVSRFQAFLESAAGERVQLQTLAKNRRSVNRAIGGI